MQSVCLPVCHLNMGGHAICLSVCPTASLNMSANQGRLPLALVACLMLRCQPAWACCIPAECYLLTKFPGDVKEGTTMVPTHRQSHRRDCNFSGKVCDCKRFLSFLPHKKQMAVCMIGHPPDLNRAGRVGGIPSEDWSLCCYSNVLASSDHSGTKAMT
jgi:hypothetical protein